MTQQTPSEKVGLPPKPFFYTIEQICTMLSISEKDLKLRVLFYFGRSVGPIPKDRLVARNVAADNEKPIWRILEKDLVRWMRFKGIKYHQRGYIQ